MSAFTSISLVYLAIYTLSAWSLNLQYGYTGIINFGWIVFQSIGAYVAATTALGAPKSGGFQTYVFGAHLAYPLPLIMGTLAGGALSLILGVIILTRRIRPDFQAIIMLVVAIIAAEVVSTNTALFNGANGLSTVPQPFNGVMHLSYDNYQWFFVGYSFALCVIVYAALEWLCRSSWGRSLRAIREDDVLAAHVGINVQVQRIGAFVIGGAIAGFSGALLVEFLGTWSPDAWSFVESFVVFVSVYVGGRGNNRGAIIGAFLVPVVFGTMPSFLPQFGYPGLTANLEWLVIAALWLTTFYIRPAGILPEGRFLARRRRAVEEAPAMPPIVKQGSLA